MTLIRTNNGLYPAQHCVFKRTVENGEDYLMLSCLGAVEFFRIMYNFQVVLDELSECFYKMREEIFAIVNLPDVIHVAEKKVKE